MRQAGVLAAAGLVALDTMVERMEDDHANARRLARGLAGIPGIHLDPERVQTNIVIFDVAGGQAAALRLALADSGVLVSEVARSSLRMVTHYGIEAGDVDRALEAVETAARVIGKRTP